MKQKSFCREPAREVLLQEQTVMTALQMVEESGMSAEAREHAVEAALRHSVVCLPNGRV